MGLISCQKCKAYYSEHLNACPKCGFPRETHVETINTLIEEVREENENQHIKPRSNKQIILPIIAFIIGVCMGFLTGWRIWPDNEENVVETVNDNTISVIDNWTEDSLAIVNRETYDLTFFEVHGPVKTIKKDNHCYEFDKDGCLILVDGYDPFSCDVYSDFDKELISYKRDKEGRISSDEMWEYSGTYKWNGKELCSREWFACSYSGKDCYYYDERGFKTKVVSFEEHDADEETNETITFTYPETDLYGNWTSIRNGDYISNRTITYYPIEKYAN